MLTTPVDALNRCQRRTQSRVTRHSPDRAVFPVPTRTQHVSTESALILPFFHNPPLSQIPNIDLGSRFPTEHPQLAPLTTHERQILDAARLSAIDRRDQLTCASRSPLEQRDLSTTSCNREHAAVRRELCLFEVSFCAGADEKSFTVLGACCASEKAFWGTKTALGAEIECVVVRSRTGEEKGCS